jgi:hypothetical protein
MKTLNSAFLSCAYIYVSFCLPPRHSPSGLSVGRSVLCEVRTEYAILALKMINVWIHNRTWKGRYAADGSGKDTDGPFSLSEAVPRGQQGKCFPLDRSWPATWALHQDTLLDWPENS